MVRLIARVHPHVSHQATSVGVSFPARLAQVRPLTCVQPHVPFQAATDCKSFSTCSAKVRLINCVGSSHVANQCTDDCKNFTTRFARVQLATAWAEPTSTRFASVVPLAGVCFKVDLKL